MRLEDGLYAGDYEERKNGFQVTGMENSGGGRVWGMKSVDSSLDRSESSLSFSPSFWVRAMEFAGEMQSAAPAHLAKQLPGPRNQGTIGEVGFRANGGG